MFYFFNYNSAQPFLSEQTVIHLTLVQRIMGNVLLNTL